ncbi:excisionase family DNA binding protein [Bradyrhizobium sp. LB9.1b]
MENKLSLTIDEATKATGIGRTKIFALLKSGDLTAFKVGRRTLIRVDDLKCFMEGRVKQAAA